MRCTVTKMIPAVDTKYYFERTFALVAYALAQHADGELVKALFHEVDGSPGIYGLYYYEPVGHAPSSTLVGYEGLLDMEGNEPKDFKTRWYVDKQCSNSFFCLWAMAHI